MSRVVLMMMGLGLVWGPAAEAGMRQRATQVREKSDTYNAEEFPWQQVMDANQRGVEFQAPGPTPPVTRDKTTVKLSLEPRYGKADDAEARRYDAVFEATYVIRNKKEAPKDRQQGSAPQVLTQQQKEAAEKTTFVIFFPFPTDADTVRDATVTVRDMDTDGAAAKDVPDAVYRQEGVSFETTFLSKQTKEITVSYCARGTEDFVFALDRDERMEKLEVSLTVPNAEHAPDLEAGNCLEPTTELSRTADGYSAEWDYTNLLTTKDIVVTVPEPFVGRNVAQRFGRLMRAGFGATILFVLLLIAGGMVSRRRLSASQYLVAIAAVIIFAPLMLHLSRIISPIAAFIIAFATVALLVVWSLRRSHGTRFALGYGVLGLVITLGMLSAAALLTSGSGLVVTITLLLLIAFGMSVSPRLTEVYEEQRAARIAAVPEATVIADDEVVADVEEEWRGLTEVQQEPTVAPPAVTTEDATAPGRFCAFCGQAVTREFRYCPHCSRETDITVECPECGVEICRTCGTLYTFCPSCGAAAPDLPSPEGGTAANDG